MSKLTDILKKLTNEQLSQRLRDAKDAQVWDDVSAIRTEFLSRPGRERAEKIAADVFNAGPEAPEDAIRRRYRDVRSGETGGVDWSQHGRRFLITSQNGCPGIWIELSKTCGAKLSDVAEEAIKQCLTFVAQYASGEEHNASRGLDAVHPPGPIVARGLAAGKMPIGEFYPLRADGAVTDAQGNVVVAPLGRVKGSRRWVDGSTRDELGNVLVAWEPDSHQARWLQTHCRGCGIEEGLICQDECPRLGAEAAKRGMTVPAYIIECDRLSRPPQPVDDCSNRLRKRVNDAFNTTGFYELAQDGFVVTLPDGDMVWMEIADQSFVPPKTVNHSDPLSSEPQVLRLVYKTFRPNRSPEGSAALVFTTPEGAANQLIDELRTYLSHVINAPHARDDLLFVSWRLQPEVRETSEGSDAWTARARFVAQWADKRFAPPAPIPVRAPNTGMIARAELGGIRFGRDIWAFKTPIAAEPTITLSDGNVEIKLALPPGEKAKHVVALKVPDDSRGDLIFVLTESGQHLFARQPGFGDIWYALKAPKPVTALWHGWLDDRKAHFRAEREAKNAPPMLEQDERLRAINGPDREFALWYRKELVGRAMHMKPEHGSLDTLLTGRHDLGANQFELRPRQSPRKKA